MEDLENPWEKFKENLYYEQELELMIDISRMNFVASFLQEMELSMKNVYRKIEGIEKGSIANPDENRMVGHYWLRNPDLAPNPEIGDAIKKNIVCIHEFVDKVHSGAIRSEQGKKFKNVLLIGIGGSSLGPRFVTNALISPNDKMKMHFIDNTDPDGMDQVFTSLIPELDLTLCLVVSKSGGTTETRNAMLEAKELYLAYGLDFSAHAIAITQLDSQLERLSKSENWLEVFPMWDWVGGRTSVLCAVGLIAMGLQGIDFDQVLLGARRCDERTRVNNSLKNPASLLALMWYKATEGKGGKEMVVLPYKDRLELFAKYLQQLVMESLGKEKNFENHVVNQGIAVYGNKGSTDQHSYVQQLLDGPSNFFVTFIEVLKDRNGVSPVIYENSTSGDYLQAYLLGTRNALSQRGRNSITITIKEVKPYSIGVLIALFERAVSMYALLVDINAYDQPAVEISKKAAEEAIKLKNILLDFLHRNSGQKYTLEELAEQLKLQEHKEILFKLLLHLRENPDHGVRYESEGIIFDDLYYID